MNKARILLMVVQENVHLHSLISYIHVASLMTYATQFMICSDIPVGLVLEALYTALLISTREQPLSSINALPKDASNSS